uniref:Uncharacterized protein n=1 Tax=Rhizophora mucronata TaxID=61149 RepID=A0A2P2P735_RHIMU
MHQDLKQLFLVQSGPAFQFGFYKFRFHARRWGFQLATRISTYYLQEIY